MAYPNCQSQFCTNWMLGVIKITACTALKRVTLRRVGVTDKWLEDLLPNLPSLEYLRLIFCKEFRETKISSDRLKHLTVSGCFCLTFVQLDTPNLTSFSYTSYGARCPTLRLIKGSVDLLNVELSVSKLDDFLLNIKPSSKAVRLWCDTEEVIVKIPKKMRKGLLPPHYVTLHCRRITFPRSTNYSVTDVLDSLLQNPDLEISTPMFVNEDASDKDDETCCASLPLTRWRQKLKNMRLEAYWRMEREELSDYLFDKCRYSGDD